MIVEIRLGPDHLRLHQFATDDRWRWLHHGDTDQITGYTFERLRELGDGVWEMEAVPLAERAATR